MHPVKTERANFTFLGDGETVGDVWGERRREDGTTRLTYEPSDTDREAAIRTRAFLIGALCGVGLSLVVALLALHAALG